MAPTPSPSPAQRSQRRRVRTTAGGVISRSGAFHGSLIAGPPSWESVEVTRAWMPRSNRGYSKGPFSFIDEVFEGRNGNDLASFQEQLAAVALDAGRHGLGDVVLARRLGVAEVVQ